MSLPALLVEILLSAFFAIACFRARAEMPESLAAVPQQIFVLTDRIERLRRSRWQWFSTVLLLVVVRLQLPTPIVAELTVLGQLLVFMALPSRKLGRAAVQKV